MKKLLGILGLLLAVCIFTALASDRFLLVGNIENLAHRTALFGILGVGAAFVIITGGIDLSTGSLVCLVGTLLPFLLTVHHWSVPAAVVAVLGLSVLIGAVHGLLITKVRLQPFIVTLCGYMLYRGIACGITGDQSQGFGLGYHALRSLATARIPIFGNTPGVFHLPATCVSLIVVAVLAAVFLNRTVWGLYLMALGRSEQAARYSGIHTDRMVILAYVVCALLGGFGGMLFVLDINAAQPRDFGLAYELYAIAAAVLGGCSLRGGEGSILGVLIGTAIIVVLSNTINLVFPNYEYVELAIIGAVILAGVIVDELVKRFAARRRAVRSAAMTRAAA